MSLGGGRSALLAAADEMSRRAGGEGDVNGGWLLGGYEDGAHTGGATLWIAGEQSVSGSRKRRESPLL